MAPVSASAPPAYATNPVDADAAGTAATLFNPVDENDSVTVSRTALARLLQQLQQALGENHHAQTLLLKTMAIQMQEDADIARTRARNLLNEAYQREGGERFCPQYESPAFESCTSSLFFLLSPFAVPRFLFLPIHALSLIKAIVYRPVQRTFYSNPEVQLRRCTCLVPFVTYLIDYSTIIDRVRLRITVFQYQSHTKW